MYMYMYIGALTVGLWCPTHTIRKLYTLVQQASSDSDYGTVMTSSLWPLQHQVIVLYRVFDIRHFVSASFLDNYLFYNSRMMNGTNFL